MNKSAIYVQDSKNSKISGNQKIDATYASIEKSCSDKCPLKNNGCYASYSYTGIIVKRLDSAAKNLSSVEVAKAEAKAIDNSYSGGNVPKGRVLRVHVSGDCKNNASAKLVNNSIGRWKKRGGGLAYSYTHSWKNVDRGSWSNVSVLASVSNLKEAELAIAKGYAPAIIVAEHESNKTYKIGESDIKWIPCPNQTNDVACADCQLCFNDQRLLKDGFGIAFAAHGVKKNDIKRHLKVIR